MVQTRILFGRAALAVCILALGAEAADRRRVELKDYYALETASRPAISPDGRWVAFVRTRVLERENRQHSEIWLAPADGAAPARRITSPAFSSSSPRWSPDGKLLAFVSRRQIPGSNADDDIWFLRLDEPGGEAFQIPGVTSFPIFSPDNQWIAFTRRTPPAEKTPGPKRSEFERLVEERFKGRIYDWMNYRRDGAGYLPDPRDPHASPPRELYVVPLAGGTPRQLTKLGVDVQEAVWSPDSRQLAMVADAHQRQEYTYERADLWLVDLEGQLSRLTDDGHHHAAPEWSPDGRHLTFLRRQGLSRIIQSRQGYGSPVDIYRIPASGGRMQNLTAEWDLIPQAPGWSRDGEFIYFSGAVGGDPQLFRIPAGGGPVEQLTRAQRFLSGFSIAARYDRMAYVGSDSARPGEVFSARPDGSDEKKLSALNDALAAQWELGRTERIVYPSDDGARIEGWVALPPDYDAARGPYPLILVIHGGPHSAFGSGFAFSAQLLAGRGYLALYTNPRGSTGYGEKFLWATWGGWGVLDYQDVMAGVRYAQKRYAIDPRRLGVTGYSYGGFLTNWIITQTNAFAAAIAGAGVSNWISDYGTADIPRTKESEFFGPPWEPRGGELLRKLSPITWAGNVSTPTLFVHGEGDFRVPIEQAEQMYTSLKKRRVPARFVRYPDTAHGGWTPWNIVHRHWQELKWWDEYLGPSK